MSEPATNPLLQGIARALMNPLFRDQAKSAVAIGQGVQAAPAAIGQALVDTVEAPFNMARDARQAGGYSNLDPTEVGRAGLNTGLGTLLPAVGGVGGRGGAVLMSGAGPTEPKGIKAFHGSPHDFDRFDMSKIGTGEGAQAYGHGLYFAESEGVAKSYRDTLAPGKNLSPGMDGALESAMASANGDRALAIKQTEDTLKMFSKYPNNPRTEMLQEVLQRLQAGEGRMPDSNFGRMYEVNIKADPDDFLDWDKPLIQQSERVRGALARVDIKPEMTGAHKTGDEIYALAGNPVPDGPDAVRQLAVSERLRDAGISGIKYLDQGSRAAGEGSRNYVVFRDDIIEVVRKYGVAAAASMFGMDAVMQAQTAEALQQ